MALPPDPRFKSVAQLVGTWVTEATHPLMPGVVVRGTATIAWLEGERFLMIRVVNDHPDFPDSLAVIGDMGQDRAGGADDKAPPDTGVAPLHMHYFDSRGVFRDYLASVDDRAWRWWRDSPGFSQRFTGWISEKGSQIDGLSQLREDDVNWTDDLQITYRRVS